MRLNGVLGSRPARFIVGGIANTAITYAFYRALEPVLGFQPAYAVAYVLGILLSYWYNATMVFKVPLSWKGLLAYPVVYLMQYGLSACLLQLFVGASWVDKAYAPLVVTACVVPATYLLTKIVLSRRSV